MSVKLSKHSGSFWASNIRHLRNRIKISQDELAGKLGITRSKLASHESGQTVNPPVEDLIQCAAFFKISIDHLIRTDLARMSEAKIREIEAGNDIYATGTQLRVLATTVDADNRENIEYVPQKAKAGYLAGYNDPEYISGLPVFHLPHLPSDRKYRMFPTSGDSMYPVPENAFVIGNYVEDWTGIRPRTACIIITKGQGIVFKMLTVRIPQQRAVLLESMNAVYEPYEVPVDEVLEVWQFVSYISNALPDPEMSLPEISRSLYEIKDILRQWNKK